MIAENLLQMLVCPETKQPVTLAPANLVERLNERIRQGALVDQGGESVKEPIDEGLLRQDGTILYPIIDGIPRMLIERGIPLDTDTTGAP